MSIGVVVHRGSTRRGVTIAHHPWVLAWLPPVSSSSLTKTPLSPTRTYIHLSTRRRSGGRHILRSISLLPHRLGSRFSKSRNKKDQQWSTTGRGTHRVDPIRPSLLHTPSSTEGTKRENLQSGGQRCRGSTSRHRHALRQYAIVLPPHMLSALLLYLSVGSLKFARVRPIVDTLSHTANRRPQDKTPELWSSFIFTAWSRPDPVAHESQFSSRILLPRGHSAIYLP